MAGDISIDIKNDVEKYLQNVGVEIDKELVQSLLDAALHAEGELKSAIMSLFTEGGTGQLARNPKAVLLQKEGKIRSSGAFLDLIYAEIQDEGGTIEPKTVKNLAIPLNVKAKRQWPREWPKDSLMYLKNKKTGKKLLVEAERVKRTRSKKGGSYLRPLLYRGEIKAHYVLKKSVTIHGKGYIERARRAAEEGIAQIIGEHIQISIERARMPT